ncbi:ATP-binding protein [Psychrobacter sp. AH5]|uniref:sensor histidine kinase n=1 Tax=Psychrobacter sp. AH5 TaxID=2937433 RepID=UPI0033413889
MIKTTLLENRLTLFWRLFLSLLLTILFTAICSILVERWLTERALNARMEVQIERILAKRELIINALEAGDMARVRQLYQEDRRFMNQISLYDEQGALIFPRYNRMPHHRGRSHSNASLTFGFSMTMSRPKQTMQQTVLGNTERFEVANTTVTLPDGQLVIIQIRPNLPFSEVVELQRGHVMVRLILIILFSLLVCFWLSRTMTSRMRQLQHTVRQLIEGNYQIDPTIYKLGADELGLLAKDVAQLATRLADSELARKQMLSDISHELRSPLARLEVATELTRDFAPSAERYLNRIDKESARMNELIEQIIHIQSLQMQQYTSDDSEKQPVNLIDIISEIGEDVCFEFQHKQLHWYWQPAKDSERSTVLGDYEQLYSALENVIRNAFIHTPVQGNVSVEVDKIGLNDKSYSTVKKSALNTDCAIQISITDEGGGVAEQDLKRIFQPFVRLDSARDRQTGGYGLGLAIVHAVITAHRGQIRAYNRQDNNRGLVIEIRLPTVN